MTMDTPHARACHVGRPPRYRAGGGQFRASGPAFRVYLPFIGLCGFDGFIDTFVRLLTPPSMAEFGPKVTAAAGMATLSPMRHMQSTCLVVALSVLTLSPASAGTKHSPSSRHPTYEGHIMCGYQGWFRAEGDGSGRGWAHYGRGKCDANNCTVDLGSPVFNRVTLRLENGETFTLIAKDNSPGNKYIQSVKLNGKPLNQIWFRHADIANGGTLELQMGNTPNRSLGTASESLPPSSAPTLPETLTSNVKK